MKICGQILGSVLVVITLGGCHALRAPVIDPPSSNRPSQPVAKPLNATFDSISENIFRNKCSSCHSLEGEGQRVLLDYQSLLNSPLDLVLPGNADESGLIIALERLDEKRMPPAEDGYTPLRPEEILVLRQWIDNGAKE